MSSKVTTVELVRLKNDDTEQFIKDNQYAFKYGATQEFGMRDNHFEECEEIISRNTIISSINGKNAEAYRIIFNGRKVGGAVINIDREQNKGELELLFISPEFHNKGIGYAAWQAIEKLHPDITVWETVTPYFETRNIHFYVNRCGFHIVEFFNSHNPDSNEPDNEYPESDDSSFGMFRFEKRL